MEDGRLARRAEMEEGGKARLQQIPSRQSRLSFYAGIKRIWEVLWDRESLT